MGNANTSFVTDISTEMNQALFSEMTTINNSSSQNCQSNQTITLVVGPTGKIICSPGQTLSLIQTGQVVCNMTANFDTNSSTNISTLLQNAISSMVQQQQKATAGFLQAAINSNYSQTDIENHIYQYYCETQITNNITNACLQQAQINQAQNININGVVYGCALFQQSAQLSAASNCIVSVVLNVLSQDSTINTITSNLKNYQSATGKGLGSVLSGFLKYLVIIVVIVVVVGLIGLVLKLALTKESPTSTIPVATTAAAITKAKTNVPGITSVVTPVLTSGPTQTAVTPGETIVTGIPGIPIKTF